MHEQWDRRNEIIDIRSVSKTLDCRDCQEIRLQLGIHWGAMYSKFSILTLSIGITYSHSNKDYSPLSLLNKLVMPRCPSFPSKAGTKEWDGIQGTLISCTFDDAR